LAGRHERDAWVAANYELGLLSLTHQAADALPPRPAAVEAADEGADVPVAAVRSVLEPPAVYFRRVLEAGDSPWRSWAAYWLAGLE